MGLFTFLPFITLFWTNSLMINLPIFSNGGITNGSTHENCQHEIINETFGILSSPCYPLSYPHSTLCKWDIVMPESSRIVLSILTFDIGIGDVLEVFESKHGEKTFYDKDNPPGEVIYALGRSITLILKAGVTNNQKEVKLSGKSKTRSFNAIFEKEGCGGVLTSDNGYILVPLYIHLSQKSHDCVWSITSAKNKVVVLNFLEFDLTPGTCLYSKLHVRDGDRNAGYIIGDFCEENPPLHDLRTATNVMFISYRTRPNLLFKDSPKIPTIKMYYHVVDACGGELTSFTGSFSSPKIWLDDAYACNWTIVAPYGKQLLVNIHNWKSFNSSSTDYDELSFIVPAEQPHTFSSKFNITPKPTMMFPTNHLTIKFASHRKRPSKPRLVFYCVYQALQSPLQQCIDVGLKKLFMCDEWNYIDCESKCNGISDCENGKDEEHCLAGHYENEFDIRRDNLKKYINISIYFTFLFVAICASLVIVVASVTFNQFYKQSQNNNSLPVQNPSIPQYPFYPNIYPPPYGTKDICTVSTFCRAPPPYPYNFEESFTDESSLRLSLVAVSLTNQTTHDQSNSTTCTDRLRDLDVPFNYQDNSRSLETLFLVDGCISNL